MKIAWRIVSVILAFSLAAGPAAAAALGDETAEHATDLTARVATESDVLLDALAEWAQRSFSELSLEEGPLPGRTVFCALDHEFYEATAVFGALVHEKGHRARPALVEVVVGDDSLDSSRFKKHDWPSSISRRPSLAVDDAPLALARDLWVSADRSYKDAVAQWRVKVAARAAQGGEPPPPDWSQAPPVKAVDLSPVEPVDRDALRNYALEASERLRSVEGLRTGEVRVRALSGRYYLATSEGTRLVQPEGYAVLYAWADQLRDDGVRVFDHCQRVARTVSDLPRPAEFCAEVEAMARSVAARADAEAVDYYEGPVVFEGTAAADFFRYLVPGEVCGTPPVPEGGKTYKQITRGGPRLGRRLLPEGWTVVDDPGREIEGLAGAYVYDREAVQGEAVTLVEDGFVRDLLMSRIPRADLQRSNGHARGSIRRGWTARPSVWEVTPERNLRPGSFEKKAARAAKESGVDRILVVRSLDRGSAGKLPRPTGAVWRDADGNEEPALSLSFQKVDRRTLRDILAAGGGLQVRPYLDAWTLNRRAGADAGIPAVIITPARLLVGEMEVVFPGPDEKPHAYLQPPLSE